MKIFGGWLPFIGFREYFSDAAEVAEIDPDMVEYFADNGRKLTGVSIHAFEVEWFERAVGFIYKTKFYSTEIE